MFSRVFSLRARFFVFNPPGLGHFLCLTPALEVGGAGFGLRRSYGVGLVCHSMHTWHLLSACFRCPPFPFLHMHSLPLPGRSGWGRLWTLLKIRGWA